MRPLRLTMTAFGPYAGSETVDFDALTELGLFVVAGNNGSGKTTIFDALHYALFGTLPGRRATYVRLRSDHAEPAVECSVVLDFVAHRQHWRIERFPKQTRPKRRGTGTTEAERRATLYRLDKGDLGPAIAVANKIGEVNDKCRELVGLTGKQFERVALLPQGQFSRVLSESNDRRELLRALFSSEIFGDATSVLTDQAAIATADDQAMLARIGDQRDAIARELGDLLGRHDAVPVTSTPTELLALAQTFRHDELDRRSHRVEQLKQQARDAQRVYQAGVDTVQRMQRRADVINQLAAHRAAQAEHERDVARLAQARAAVPVASQARAVAQQNHRLGEVAQQVDTLRDQLAHALKTAGLPPLDQLDVDSLSGARETVAKLSERLGQRRSAAASLADLDRAVKKLQGDLRRRHNEIAKLDDDKQIAVAQQRQSEHQLAQARAAGDLDACANELARAETQLQQRLDLVRLDDRHERTAAELARLDQQLEATKAQRLAAEQAVSNHHSLATRAQAAIDELERSNQRRAAAQAFHAATAKLAQARTASDRSRARATAQWDAFIAGTAVRVAEALVDDEPCPVCGSAEHPQPATAVGGEHVPTDDDVTAARLQAEADSAEVNRLEAQIEALHADDPSVATTSLADLAAEITTAKAMAFGARTAADEALAAASQREPLAIKCDDLEASRRQQQDEIRQVDELRNQLRGALGPVADEPVDTLRNRAHAAADAHRIAQQAHAASETLHEQLEQATATIDTIGLQQIAADNRLASTKAQLVDRQADFDQAKAQLDSLDSELGGSSADFELRIRACRGADTLLHQLGTAVALRNETHEAQRRAQSILEERLNQSPFAAVDSAQAAFIDPEMIEQIEAHVRQFATTGDQLQGQLQELSDLPTEPPNVAKLHELAQQTELDFTTANHEVIATTSRLTQLEADLRSIVQTLVDRENSDIETRRIERVAAMVKGDNDRNTSLENWVLAAHLRDVVELANLRLAKSTHQRFQLCVLDTGENRRGTWGLDLGVEDTVTGTRRPTAGLSGGELFQASLALALGLADAVMNQSAGVQIDALFIDEGFGSLDDNSVERAIDLLDELRDQGAMVGVITHVPALRNALPRGITVVPAADGRGSTIKQSRIAA